MKKILLLAAIISVACAAGTRAQAAATDNSPEAYKEAVTELLKAMNYDESIAKMGDAYGNMFSSTNIIDTSKLPIFMNRLAEEMPALCIKIYPKYYTVDEIKSRTAYLNSPLGKKETAKTPILFEDLTTTIQEMAKEDTQTILGTLNSIDPAFLAAMNEYFETIDYDTLLKQQFKASGLPDDQLDSMMTVLRMASYRVYPKHFTIDEVKQLTEAAKDPVAKKFIKNMPALQQELQTASMPAVMEIMKEVFPELPF